MKLRLSFLGLFATTIDHSSHALVPSSRKRSISASPLFVTTLPSTNQDVAITWSSTMRDSFKESFLEIDPQGSWEKAWEKSQHILRADPGTLDTATRNLAFSFLLAWGRTGTMEGAKTAEKLARRLYDEERFGERTSSPQVDRRYFTVVAAGYSKANSLADAERIISEMQDLSQDNADMSPSRATYHSVMCGYARNGQPAKVSQVLSLLETADDELLHPTTKDYNALLYAYACNGRAHEAEDVLKRMVLKCKDMDASCPSAPDIFSYYALLEAWRDSKLPGRGARAEEILNTLIQQYELENSDISPDGRVFSIAIMAVANSNESHVHERVIRLWDRAVAMGVKPEPHACSTVLNTLAHSGIPDAAEVAEKFLDTLAAHEMVCEVTFNTALKAWMLSNKPCAAERAESLLRRMETYNFANVVSYSTVMATHAARGTKESAQRAEELLQVMKGKNIEPSATSMNSVINAWCRCGEIANAERVLESMEAAYKRGASDVRPSVVSYTTLINGYTKEGSSWEKSIDLFDRMNGAYAAGNDDAKPNLFSYVSLAGCLAGAGDGNAMAEAHRLVSKLMKDYECGATDITPSARLITTVIDGWQKCGERSSGQRAEELMNRLVEVHRSRPRESTRPNQHLFASTITALAKSRQLGKARRALRVLRQMAALHEEGVVDSMPNSYCYTGVINCCAFVVQHRDEQTEALQIAIAMYKEMLTLEHAKPTEVTFVTILTAIRNLSPPGKKRSAAATNIFQTAAKEGMVSSAFVERLATVLDEGELEEVVGVRLERGKPVDITMLPKDWTKNCGSLPPSLSTCN